MPQHFRYKQFNIRITADEFKRYYKGTAKYVITRAHDGQRVQFPASILQRFLTHDGISGEFIILYDENNKLVEIQKLT